MTSMKDHFRSLLNAVDAPRLIGYAFMGAAGVAIDFTPMNFLALILVVIGKEFQFYSRNQTSTIVTRYVKHEEQ